MKIIIYSLIVFLISDVKFYAQVVDLNMYKKMVEQNNKYISASKSMSEAIRYDTLYYYLPSNPVIDIENMYIGLMSEKSIFLKQNIENPIKIKINKKLVFANYNFSKYQYEYTKNRILKESETLFYEYLYITKKKEILNEMLVFLKELFLIYQSYYKTGSVLLDDILKIDLKQFDLDKAIKELELEEKKILLNLRFYANNYEISFSTYFEEEISFNYDEDNIISRINLNSEVLMLKTNIELADLNYRISKILFFPEFMIGYRKRFESKSYDLMFGFEIPLFITKNKAGINKKLKEKESAFDTYTSVLSEKINYAKEVLYKLKTYYEIVYLYKYNILPKAYSQLELVRSKYKIGVVEINEVLDVFDDYLKLKNDYYYYLFEFYKSKAILAELVGGNL